MLSQIHLRLPHGLGRKLYPRRNRCCVSYGFTASHLHTHPSYLFCGNGSGPLSNSSFAVSTSRGCWRAPTCPHVLVCSATSGPSHPRACPAAPRIPAASSQLHGQFCHRASLLRPLLVRLSGSQRADFHQVLEGRFPTSPAGVAPGGASAAHGRSQAPGSRWALRARWAGCPSKLLFWRASVTLSSQRLITQSPVTVTQSLLNPPCSHYCPGRTPTDTPDFILIAGGLGTQ